MFEKNDASLDPSGLRDLVADGPPATMPDLVALVIEELAVAQRRLTGDDLDSVRVFWTDANIPRDENYCRDRLTALLAPELSRYGVHPITEADMPRSKRVDLVFAAGSMRLPMEIKGRWHKDVWDAASTQLDRGYLTDWRSVGHGIYGVLWFGAGLPSSTGRCLRGHPDGKPAPTTADAMRRMLIDRIPADRRANIKVVVVDLTAGKR